MIEEFFVVQEKDNEKNSKQKNKKRKRKRKNLNGRNDPKKLKYNW